MNTCIKCGSKDIKIWDCGYSSFNVGGADCKKCGNKVKLDMCGCFPKNEIIDIWNKANPTLKKAISNIESQIDKLKGEIQEKRNEISELTRVHMMLKYDNSEKIKNKNRGI